MTIRTSAVVLPECGRVAVADVDLPTPGEEDLAVRILLSGISAGTERWVLQGRYGPARFPLIPGYQSVGVVERVGAKVSEFKPGDVVFAGTTRTPEGMHAWWGGHTARAVLPSSRAVRIPPGVSLEEAALSALVAVAHHGVRLLPLRPGAIAAVVGLGMVGQLVAQLLDRAGVVVIGSDPLKARRDRATALGLRQVVDPAAEHLEEAVRALAQDGADVVIECTGLTHLVGSCLRLLRFGGTLSLQGYYPGNIVFPFEPAHRAEATIKCPRGWPRSDHEAALALLAGKGIRVAPLITHRLPAKDAVHAYELLTSHPEDTLGIVLDWDQRSSGP
ncbi:MAG TPA: zinc-binding alcohol dehydrogenase [bacterium]|nr:zinc-binding alcohol dehydrogenase [bacterium]